MSPERLQLDVCVRRGGFRLELETALALEGVTAVFGPSGSGKSTLLRAIAGFERPERGRIALGADTWFDSGSGIDLPAHKRGAGLMFQDARLFAHHDVERNLRFAARRSPGGFDRPLFSEVCAATGLEGLLKRRVETLSGGEARRVALARTLLSRPRLLLLDEPMTGLDRASRRALLPYLKRAPARFGLPMLLVSHDIEEVAALADRMLVLRQGRMIAEGPLMEAARALDLAPLQDGQDRGSLLEVRRNKVADGQALMQFSLGGETLSVPRSDEVAPGEVARLYVRAREVTIALDPPGRISIRNILRARVSKVTALEGGEVDIALEIGGQALHALVTETAASELGLEPGLDVYALIKSLSLMGRL